MNSPSLERKWHKGTVPLAAPLQRTMDALFRGQLPADERDLEDIIRVYAADRIKLPPDQRRLNAHAHRVIMKSLVIHKQVFNLLDQFGLIKY